MIRNRALRVNIHTVAEQELIFGVRCAAAEHRNIRITRYRIFHLRKAVYKRHDLFVCIKTADHSHIRKRFIHYNDNVRALCFFKRLFRNGIFSVLFPVFAVLVGRCGNVVFRRVFGVLAFIGNKIGLEFRNVFFLGLQRAVVVYHVRIVIDVIIPYLFGAVSLRLGH